jgi:subtilisin family serine protease
MKLQNFRAPWIIFVLLLFSSLTFYSFYQEPESSLTGYVVAENGVRIKTEKLDNGLIEKIQEGENNPKVYVELNNDNIDKVVKNSGAKVKHEFENSVSLEINDASSLKKLSEDKNVKKIYYDYQVSVTLDNSIPRINADYFINNLSITGENQAICVIDTGIDYTHDAFGNCDSSTLILEGQTESYLLESTHPYPNNADQVWTITKEGYENIALHFNNLSLEQIGEYDTLDRILIYGPDYEIVAVYKGVMENFWTPSVEGDTIYVQLVSDGSVNDYGFYIDQVINGTTNTTIDWNSCNKIVNGWDFYNNDNDPIDDNSHGTHCAGIISSNDATYQGAAPGTKLVAIKSISSSGSGYASDVLAGINWCVSNAEKHNIVAISMSLGDGSSHQEYCNDNFLAPAINNAVDNNIAVFIAAGNNNPLNEGISAPACIESATPVGAVDSSDNLVYKRGDILDIVAPGTSIRAPVLSNNYGYKSGTSMATPHAVAVAALLKEYYLLAYGQQLTVSELETILATKGKIVYDSSTNKNYSLVDLEYLVKPKLSYSENTANGNVGTDFVINFSSDVPLDYSIINFNNTNYQTNNTHYYLNNVTPGNYSYYVKSYDSLNSSSTLSLMNITVLEPGNYSLVINSPQNNSYLQDFVLNLTLDNVKQLNYTITNLTGIVYQGNETYLELNLLDDNYNLTINYNNVTEQIGFIIDQTLPVINVIVPAVNSLSTSVTFNVGINELNLDYLILSTDLNGTWVNHSITNTLNLPRTFIAGEIINFKYYARDLANNYVQTQTYNFTVADGCLSSLEITEPTDSELELGEEIEFVAESDRSVEYSWLINNEQFNGNNVDYTFTEIGQYVIYVNATNGPGCFMEENITININDTLAPEITMFYHDKVQEGAKQEIIVELEDASNITQVKLYYQNNVSIINQLEYNFTVINGKENFTLYVQDEHGNKKNKFYEFEITPKTVSASGGSSQPAPQPAKVNKVSLPPLPDIINEESVKEEQALTTQENKQQVKSNLAGAATGFLEGTEHVELKGLLLKIMAVIIILLTGIYIKIK